MKVGSINFKKIPKVQYYVLVLSLFTSTAWWFRSLFMHDDNDTDIKDVRISNKQILGLVIGLCLTVIGWVESVFFFNSIKYIRIIIK